MCDGASSNRWYQEKGFTEGEIEKVYMIEPFGSRKIFFISDPSHAFKKIVNSLCNFSHHVTMSIDGGIYEVSLRLLQQLWEELNMSGIGANLFGNFELGNFLKSKVSQMNVASAIKTIGPPAIAMMEYAMEL